MAGGGTVARNVKSATAVEQRAALYSQPVGTRDTLRAQHTAGACATATDTTGRWPCSLFGWPSAPSPAGTAHCASIAEIRTRWGKPHRASGDKLIVHRARGPWPINIYIEPVQTFRVRGL